MRRHFISELCDEAPLFYFIKSNRVVRDEVFYIISPVLEDEGGDLDQGINLEWPHYHHVDLQL